MNLKLPTKRIKLLAISEFFYPNNVGGGELSMLTICEELAKYNFMLHVLTSKYKNAHEVEKYKGMTIFRKCVTGKVPGTLVDSWHRYYTWEKTLLKAVLELGKKYKYDIYHCFNSTSIYAVKLKEELGGKWVTTLNSIVPFCPKGTGIYKDKEVCPYI